jgi:hypothetical protein
VLFALVGATFVILSACAHAELPATSAVTLAEILIHLSGWLLVGASADLDVAPVFAE